ncbi:molybdopterin-dependent oxidoreductase [Chloroflexota bacterium]
MKTLSSSKTKVIKSGCPMCYMQCGINAYVEDGKLVKVEGMPEHLFSRGYTCPRGEHLSDYVYSPDRLKYPMKKENGNWKRITWDEALDTIANKLQQIKNQYGAHSLALVSGSMTGEVLELGGFIQRFSGAYGTPNYLGIEGICTVTKMKARILTFGIYPREDPEEAKCIVLWGHNPENSYGPVANIINEALDKGASLIVIDPKRIPLAERGLYLQIRPGTDCALALAMMNVIIAEGLYNREFVEKYTIGFDKLVEHVKQYSPEKVEEITWVPADDIKRAARIFAEAESACIIPGVNTPDQHINGFQNHRAFTLLQVITGNYDVPGGWVVNPQPRLTDLRIPVDEKPIGADEYPLFYQFWDRPPSPYGQITLLPDVVFTEKPYPIKAIIVTGGNPATFMPDSEKVKQAFNKVDMVVVMDLWMTESAELADIVLPACSCVEWTGINYIHAIHGLPILSLRQKVIEPLWECWPDRKFYTELGRRMGYGEYFPWNTNEEVVENWIAPSGVTIKQLEEHPEGIFIGSKCYDVTAKGQIRTPSGKIEIYSETLAQAGHDPLPVHKEPSQSPVSNPELAKEYPLILTTGARNRAFTHSQMRNIPQLRELAPEPMAEVHPDTAQKYGVADGDTVALETRRGQIKIKVKTTQDMAPQVVSIPHGWAQANANSLTELEPRDPVMGYPEMRALACRIRKV